MRLLSSFAGAEFLTIFNVSVCGSSLACLAGAIFFMIFKVSLCSTCLACLAVLSEPILNGRRQKTCVGLTPLAIEVGRRQNYHVSLPPCKPSALPDASVDAIFGLSYGSGSMKFVISDPKLV